MEWREWGNTLWVSSSLPDPSVGSSAFLPIPSEVLWKAWTGFSLPSCSRDLKRTSSGQMVPEVSTEAAFSDLSSRGR